LPVPRPSVLQFSGGAFRLGSMMSMTQWSTFECGTQSSRSAQRSRTFFVPAAKCLALELGCLAPKAKSVKGKGWGAKGDEFLCILCEALATTLYFTLHPSPSTRSRVRH
jgi:hypothetical protein